MAILLTSTALSALSTSSWRRSKASLWGMYGSHYPKKTESKSCQALWITRQSCFLSGFWPLAVFISKRICHLRWEGYHGTSDQRLCIGPDASLKFWHETRSALDIVRGPSKTHRTKISCRC